MGDFLQDVRFAARTLRKNPGFTVVAVIALALGIGANAAIFSVVNGILLRPFPFPDADRVLRIYEENPERDWRRQTVTGPNFTDWRNQNTVFESMAVVSGAAMNLTGEGEPEAVTGVRISPDMFKVIGIEPRLGRPFTAEEFQQGRAQVVIMGDGLWKRRFGADPNVIGRTITLNGLSYNVVGVMGPRSQWPFTANLWVPRTDDLAALNRRSQFLNAIGRLKPGTTIEQAQTEMTGIAARLENEYPRANTGWTVGLQRLTESVIGDMRLSLLVLLCAVGFVLLIACVNVANLLLARASAREKEIAVRTSMGASRPRLIRQLLTESLLLSFLGGLLGLLLAYWGIGVLVALSPANIPRLEEIVIDQTVLLFAFLISLTTGMIFGLVPALQMSKMELHDTLKEGGMRVTAGARRQQVRSLLIVAELALGIVLLIGAGLMLQSFANLQKIDLGFQPNGLLGMRIPLPNAKYPTRPQVAAFFEQAVERMQSLPGVESVAAVTDLPLGGGSNSLAFNIIGRPPLPDGQFIAADYSGASPGYFKTLGIPIVKGREFAGTDRAGAPRVAIVSEQFVKRFFPDEEVLGKRIANFDASGEPYEIIGVVKDVHHDDVTSEPAPKMYACYLQNTSAAMSIVLRTSVEPTSLASAARQQIWSIDKDQPINNLTNISDFVVAATAQSRLNTTLLGIFAAVALILGAVGIYGVINYSVTQRTHEIGIRMALGAKQRDVLFMVVRQGMLMALIGVVVGLAGAFALTRAMTDLLYQVSATDPLIFTMVPIILITVAFLASYIPARRATRVDPMIALRYE